MIGSQFTVRVCGELSTFSRELIYAFPKRTPNRNTDQ